MSVFAYRQVLHRINPRVSLQLTADGGQVAGRSVGVRTTGRAGVEGLNPGPDLPGTSRLPLTIVSLSARRCVVCGVREGWGRGPRPACPASPPDLPEAASGHRAAGARPAGASRVGRGNLPNWDIRDDIHKDC